MRGEASRDAGRMGATDSNTIEGHVAESALGAARAALLPDAAPSEPEDEDEGEEWQVYELALGASTARVGIVHRLEAAHPLYDPAAPAYVVDLVCASGPSDP